MHINSIKLKPRLVGAFLIVAVIAAIIGTVGITNIRTIDAADTKLYEANTLSLDYSTK